MVITCPHCTRTNPAGAKYCFFDGYSLSGAAQDGPVDPGSQPFPKPFVFPTGERCENFDQLALNCQQDWNSAKELLRTGVFETFLGGLGRADLAMAAKEVVKFPDLNCSLDQFISKLPSQAVPRPRLEVESAELHLGSRPAGTDGSFVIKMRNLGSRLVYGSLSANAAWLQPGEPADSGPKLIQFQSDGEVKVSIRGQHLRAGANTLEGKLVFETNGGTAEVVIKIDVPVVPFAGGVLAGAVTPRQLAEKALKSAKEAAPFFENGSVATWYQKNGWAYPVPGPVASGLGAVQQFFEALGLTKPPRLQLRDQDIKLAGAPGTALTHMLQVTTPDNKPIFVHASSSQSWLFAGRVQVKGATACVPLQIREVPDQPGQVLSARVIVTGNGNQRFDVPVSLQVDAVNPAMTSVERPKPTTRTAVNLGDATPLPGILVDSGPSRPKTKAVAASSHSGPSNPFEGLDHAIAPPRKTGLSKNGSSVRREEKSGRRPVPISNRSANRTLLHSLPLSLLLLVIGGVLTADIFRSARQSDEPKFAFNILDEEEIAPARAVLFKVEDEPEENKAGPVKVEIRDEASESMDGIPIDPDPLVNFILNHNNKTMTSFGVITTPASGAEKKLTYQRDGSTNSTVVMIDGKTQRFGNADPDGGKRYFRDLPKGQVKKPFYSDEVWAVGANKLGQGGIHFNEILEVVPGGQPAALNGKLRRRLDTVLARYVIRNRDKVPHKVGMRFQVDTFIGTNDGVPFTVPSLPGLVDTCTDFAEAKEVPDFLQALEHPDLLKPGTIAHLTLKLGGVIEPPSRVSITRWPGNDNLNWDVPVLPFKSKENPKGDSAVIIYWNQIELKPGEKREIGYAYGLGTLSCEDKAGNLAVTLGGSFEPGDSFTITAYVRDPVAGQTLTLGLPEGLERVSGAEVVTYPGGRDDPTWIVTWKAKVLRTGEFPVQVKSSTGISQTKTVNISRDTGGKFDLTLDGTFELGQTFDVVAHVTEPVARQTLTLNLPPGLELQDRPETRNVPAPAGGPETVVRWKVKLLEPGKHQVKVTSSTGVTHSKTITIVRPGQPGAVFHVQLKGDFAPGKSFQVIAQVPQPAPGQTLTLELPKGLEAPKEQRSKNVPPGANSSVSWTVKILETGKHPLKVVSDSGIAVKKTLAIEGGSFKMDFEGTIAPGKEFRVLAKVIQPLANQKLRLILPDGVKLLDPTAELSVPAADKDGFSTVAWNVRLEKAGSLAVQIESSTGQVKMRTISSRIY